MNDAITTVMKACNHKTHYKLIDVGFDKPPACLCSLVRELLS